MVTERMTVHKALTELKTIDSRISKLLNSGKFVTSKQHSATKVCGTDVNEWKKEQQSIYDQLVDLIKRKNALRQCVTASNAVTLVTVCGGEYTVAQAISMKNDGMTAKKQLLEKLISARLNAEHDITEYNYDLDDRAEHYVISLYGKENTKIQSAEVVKTREEFIEAQTCDLVDAIGVEKICKQLNEEIDNFMIEVDGALSTSNALTEIEITY